MMNRGFCTGRRVSATGPHIAGRIRCFLGLRLVAFCMVIAGVVGIWPVDSGLAQEEVVVPFGSEWRWRKGTSEASNPPSAWRARAFDDGSWSLGAMPVYYGNYTVTNGTRLADMQNSYTTVYLRKAFVVENISDVATLSLRELIDDGFIVWINGTEVQRYNVRDGELPYNAVTPTAIGAVPVEAIAMIMLSPGLLVEGTNVIAVHGINRNLTSSDFYLDLELRLTRRVTAPPAVASVSPAPGSNLSALTEVKVVFNKPVVGIEAHEFYINGQPATAVTGASGTNTYVFRFSQPTPGPVEMRFGANHCITDLEGSRFDETAAGSSWSYVLADTIGPRIVTVFPVPGATVGMLRRIEIWFDEPVTGVDAADLLVNGQRAAQVVGVHSGPYTFTFSEPEPGVVTVRWADGHGIRDLSPAGNAYAGGAWTYSLSVGSSPDDVVINEFLADNLTGLLDEDGQKQDWIELLNRGTNSVNLLGWSLTDTPEDPGKWVFPSVTLKQGQYLVIFASGKDRKPTAVGAKLHTNFRLNPAGGYLGLFGPDLPRRCVSEFAPSYPEQRGDISYGLSSNDKMAYFVTPTPGAANAVAGASAEFVQSPNASVKSGFYDAPFNVVLSTATDGAEIRYTLDGSTPMPTSSRYTGPINIIGTPSKAVVVLRAAAFKAGCLPSRTVTHTYIFPYHVVTQPARPAGFPEIWDSPRVDIRGDYEMDPDIVNKGTNAAIIRTGLMKLPTLSIVTDVSKLFGAAEGVYVRKDDANQQPVHVELLFPDATRGFSTPAGLEIQGGTSPSDMGTNTWKSKKLSLRLLFKGAFGARSLEYPLFEDSPVTRFNTLVLDNGLNYVWHYNGGSSTEDQRVRAQYVRDAFVSDLQRVISGTSAHWRFVHVYLNGLYWGITGLHERPDDKFAEEYFGGDSAEYDVLRHNANNVVAGNNTAYNQMFSLARGGLSNNAAYETLQQMLDLPWFIDYMIINFWAGNTDWAHQNWYACRRRVADGKWRYLSWDAEHVLKSPSQNSLSLTNSGGPTELFQLLRANPEFRVRFGDHVQRHFFNGGIFSVDSTKPVPLDNPAANRPAALYLKRIWEIDPAMVGESARWGDSGDYGVDRSNNPLTRDGDWIPELLALMGWTNSPGHSASFNFFPTRSGMVLDQFISAGLYPSVAAPSFSQHGGTVPVGYELRITAPAGKIYYTTNGVDPRVYGSGSVSPAAIAYAGPIRLDRSVTVKARVLSGVTWSALSEAAFTVGTVGLPVIFSEIMYNPLNGDAFEFLEIQNTGPVPLDLGGFRIEGIDCTIPSGTVVAPGAVLVFANGSDPEAFSTRYPGVVVTAYYRGNLSNAGERIALIDPRGRTVLAVQYDDEGGWPILGDGTGFSIEPIDPVGDPNAPANWRASERVYGTPGQPPRLPASSSSVVLSEIMADNRSAVTNGASCPDWIEIHNHGLQSADLSGWSITDDSNPRKFVFPSGTVVEPGGYLIVWCDLDPNASGIHSGFRLDRRGESVLLYDRDTNRVDGVTYGWQLTDQSVARIDGAWKLAIPTPGGPNVPANIAPQAGLCMNEWLANAPPGGSDWIEFFNRSSDAPVDLSGLFVETDDAIVRLPGLSFVPPRGYMLLFADELSGSEHLECKLPASGGRVTLSSASAEVIDRITYGPQSECVSEGRLPDGASTIVAFPGSASPGAANYLISWSGPVLNEILARNIRGVVSPWGDYAGYIELFNPADHEVDLSGFSLAVTANSSERWFFPQGSVMGPGGYLCVWCRDVKSPGASIAQVPNTGFVLDARQGEIGLFDRAGRLVDAVKYGFQVADMPIGRSGGNWRLMAGPSPGADNGAPAQLGPITALRINEWMAAEGDDSDWFELYNTASLPVELSGLFLTDDPSIAGRVKSPVADLSFIGARDWVCFVADGNPSAGPCHVHFSLDRLGETIRVYGPDLTLVDSVDFGLQTRGVSEGRLPDGSERFASFPGTPSPGTSNYVPLPEVVINEVLSNPDESFEDAIELYNPTELPVNVGGWYLSDSVNDPMRYRIPDGTLIAPHGYRVFYQCQFGPATGDEDQPPKFSLSGAHGDSVYLSETDAAGNLTGRRTAVTFGASAKGVSFGRYATSVDVDFVSLRHPTFGADNVATLEQFRTGTGAENTGPLVGPIVVSEIMYHPPANSSIADAAVYEFIELHNIASTNVPLYDVAHPTNVWRLARAVRFDFSEGTVMPPGAYVVVVPFDPVTEVDTLAEFKARYGDVPTIVFGPYMGRLDNAGDVIELLRPDNPVQPPATDAGYVPYLLVDRVCYDDASPWPMAADSGGASLQRIEQASYGNDPVNWKAEAPTPGRPNNSSDTLPPVIVGQPENVTVAVGQRAEFRVVSHGTPPLQFQWYYGGDPVSGATNETLLIEHTAPAHAGEYRVEVANRFGSILSAPAVLTVLAPPLIVAGPHDLTVNLGEYAEFVVKAEGTKPLFYQWQHNGVDLPGRTNAVLSIAVVSPGDSGVFTVIVRNSIGAAMAGALLDVRVPPVITGQPRGGYAAVQGTFVFEVSATGDAPLTYQWLFNGNQLPGCNSPMLMLNNLTEADAGEYSVLVGNHAGNVLSEPAVLIIVNPPLLLAPAIDQEGEFVAILSGPTNHVYALESTTNLVDWTEVTRVFNDNLQIRVIDPSAPDPVGRYYRVRLTE